MHNLYDKADKLQIENKGDTAMVRHFAKAENVL